MPRRHRSFILYVLVPVALAAVAGWLFVRVSSRNALVGHMDWLDPKGTPNQYHGTVFILLEEDYARVGYAGLPAGDWTDPSYVAWQATQEKLTEDRPDFLLQAPLDATGRFSIEHVPRGRHVVFIRWGCGPDPRDALSGPYEVVIEDGVPTEQSFPVTRLDVLNT